MMKQSKARTSIPPHMRGETSLISSVPVPLNQHPFAPALRVVRVHDDLKVVFTTQAGQRACATPSGTRDLTFVDLSENTAAAGSINMREWDFGDGKGIKSATANSFYCPDFPCGGDFKVTLTVTDKNQQRGSISKTVFGVRIDSLISNFAPTYGLYHYDQAGGWKQWNTVDPGQMTAVDIDNDGVEELVFSFSGFGLYYFDETNGWQLLNQVVPEDMKPINFHP